MHPKVLIVGTSPYNTQGPARAFETYFSNWEKENLIQIFTSPIYPVPGHCKELFQITDSQMLKRWLNPSYKVGIKYQYEQLVNNPEKLTENIEKNGFISKLYSIGSKKNSLVYLLRSALWKKRFWCTKQLEDWVEQFQPECVFLAFSDDFFILRIALYFAEKYDIPIVSCIGDDYYFNDRKTKSLLYHYYRSKYKSLVRKVLGHGGSAAYIGDKIRNKYNDFFGLNGDTVYLTSDIKTHKFREISKDNATFLYCGNLRLGRNHALNDIGNALFAMNPNYKLYVYSNEKDPLFLREIQDNKGIVFGGAIPYLEVVKKMGESDVLVVVEGFSEEDVNITRYSLSTKVADSLAAGGAVFAYGSLECGAIEYAKSTGCITVCTEKNLLEETLKEMIFDTELQRKHYDTARMIVRNNHTLSNSNRVFENIVTKAINQYKPKRRGYNE